MKENALEYLDSIVNTIIFTSALGLLIIFLGCLCHYNKNSMAEFKNKSSISMNTTDGYMDNYIYVNGSEVFNDIINLDEDLPVYLNGTELTADYLKFLRENNSTYINNLKSIIDLNGEYLIKHTYYSNNQIKAAYYEHK